MAIRRKSREQRLLDARKPRPRDRHRGLGLLELGARQVEHLAHGAL
jgi:hypothetical protein